VVHAADFDNDGNADLVWQNSDGSTALWLMDGTSLKSANALLGGGSGWSVRRVVDLNGDGKADIVWQHTDGTTVVWLMDGTASGAAAQLLGPGTGWSVTNVSP
jgi:hypothetical protein